MASPTTASTPPEIGNDASRPAAAYTAGTLRYDRRQILVLFFWLMWNDFSIVMIEQVGNLNGFLMKDHGATYTQMALLGSIGGFILPWINPWVSTWSDRHRGRYGRRRPFLFVATPFFALFLALIPFMPDFYRYLLRFPFVAALTPHLPMSGEVLLMGICQLAGGMFNAVVLAIFSYLYWDVVPEPVMGRFQSMSKNATLIAGLVWSFFIFGLADKHMKEVYVGTAAICLVIYLISTWQIKEGNYPPPDVHKKGGKLAPVRAYFVECFSQSYYLWIFFASFLYQLGNSGNFYQSNYLHYDLQLSLETIGWTQGWARSVTVGFGALFGFAIGSMTDRLKPVRLMGPTLILLALVMLGQFFFVRDKWTYLYWFCGAELVRFALGIVIGAFTVEIFPREKLGQFCSAQAVFYQVILNILATPTAMLFDRIQFNSLGFLWTAVFYFLAALTYMKVHANWKQRHGQTPLPQAG